MSKQKAQYGVSQIIPVILCGGAGSRLWPYSRARRPKPFIALDGGESLIQKTYRRVLALGIATPALVVSHYDMRWHLRDAVTAMAAFSQGGSLPRYLFEPCARNTAAAIASAAALVARDYGEDAIMFILPADHIIDDDEALARALEAAVVLAESEQLVAFGVRPLRAETGYGYIEADGAVIRRFVEKPDAVVAAAFVESGRFYWNSGMFCFQAGVVLREMAAHCDDILCGVQAAFASSIDEPALAGRHDEAGGVILDADVYAGVRAQSFDYAVMEKTQNASMVACEFAWHDVGAWDGVDALLSLDGDGNAHVADAGVEVIAHETRDTVILAREQDERRVIAAVGVEGLAIIDTRDALLVVDKAHAQSVRAIYETLAAAGHPVHEHPRGEARPWGVFSVLEDMGGYKVKRLEVKPDGRLSLQSHTHRDEHWVVVQGIARVRNGDAELTLRANQSTHIRAGSRHRLHNIGAQPLVLIEVQTGDYLGEDDIQRFEDDYGRITKKGD